MSNTYFKITKTKITPKFLEYPEISTKMELTLTAFVGKSEHTQLTIQTNCTLEGQSGTAYYQLNDKDVDNLIAGLLERKLKKISATGYEQSQYCPEDTE